MREYSEIETQIIGQISSYTAERAALASVEINTSHNKLTNRAITSDGATLRDNPYATDNGPNKELAVYYQVGHTWKQTKTGTVSATEFTGETDGICKLKRLISPNELVERIAKRIEILTEQIGEAEAELAALPELYADYERLAALLSEHNRRIVYADALRFTGFYG